MYKSYELVLNPWSLFKISYWQFAPLFFLRYSYEMKYVANIKDEDFGNKNSNWRFCLEGFFQIRSFASLFLFLLQIIIWSIKVIIGLLGSFISESGLLDTDIFVNNFYLQQIALPPGCGSRFSGSLSGIEPWFTVTRDNLGRPIPYRRKFTCNRSFRAYSSFI